MHEDDLIDLRFSLSIGIQIAFVLQETGSKLLASCGAVNPDNASGLIISELWRSIQSWAVTNHQKVMRLHDSDYYRNKYKGAYQRHFDHSRLRPFGKAYHQIFHSKSSPKRPNEALLDFNASRSLRKSRSLSYQTCIHFYKADRFLSAAKIAGKRYIESQHWKLYRTPRRYQTTTDLRRKFRLR